MAGCLDPTIFVKCLLYVQDETVDKDLQVKTRVETNAKVWLWIFLLHVRPQFGYGLYIYVYNGVIQVLWFLHLLIRQILFRAYLSNVIRRLISIHIKVIANRRIFDYSWLQLCIVICTCTSYHPCNCFTCYVAIVYIEFEVIPFLKSTNKYSQK